MSNPLKVENENVSISIKHRKPSRARFLILSLLFF